MKWTDGIALIRRTPKFLIIFESSLMIAKMKRAHCMFQERTKIEIAGDWTQCSLSRGETHVFVHCAFINLMKAPNEQILLFNKVPSNHFMFKCRVLYEMMSL